MRALLTGATGYVGSYLLARLIERGDHVRILALPGTEAKLRDSDEVRLFPGSLADLNVLDRATRGASVVYHLGGLYPDSPITEMIRVNVDGSENLLRGSAKNRVRRLVYVSSAAVYRRAVRPFLWPIKENFPLRTFTRDNIGRYALTKIQAEDLVTRYHHNAGLEYVILRPTEIYGPPRRYFEQLIAKAAYHPRLALRESPRYGHMQWVHLTDFVNALLRAGSRPEAANHIFNIAGDELFTLRDLIPIVWRLIRSHNCSPNNSPVHTNLQTGVDLKFDSSKSKQILRFFPKMKLDHGLAPLVATVKRNYNGFSF